MTALSQLMRPGATLSLLVSSTPRDQGVGVAPIQEETLLALAKAYRCFGLKMTTVRPATAVDVAAAHSTWGKRLGAGVQRPAWVLRATFAASSPESLACAWPQR